VPLPVPRPPGADALPQAVADARAEAPAYSPTGLDRALNVIKQKESSGNYSNVTDSGRGRSAIGAYGVMDFNVGPWTKEVLGREMSPQEFLRSPAAQDAVARAKFGDYASKYGLTGAAKARLAGEGGMNRNVADRFGTTPMAYADDFNRKLGLPPEITSGQSRPTEEPSQRMSFDQVRDAAAQNLTSQQPAHAAGLTSDQVSALYRNPVTRPLALGFLQKQLDPGTYEFMAAGDNVVRYNKTTGAYTAIPMHQKPVAVPEKSALVDPETGKVIYNDVAGGGGAGDLPQNMRWIDPKDRMKGVEPIPGGTGEKIEAEVGARLGLAKSFMGQLPQIQQRITAGEVGIDNPANHIQAMAGVGAPGELRRQIDSGADALQRMLTGAGMPREEAADYTRRYKVDARDTSTSLTSKMEQLSRELTTIGNVMGRGRGGSVVVENGRLKAAGDEPAPPAASAPGRAALEAEMRKRGLLR
jgi:hypothetical protein